MLKIIYLSIHFSHVGLDVILDYDNINTILFLFYFIFLNLYFFSPLELYLGFFKRKKSYNLLFFPFIFIILNCSFVDFLGVFDCMVEKIV